MSTTATTEPPTTSNTTTSPPTPQPQQEYIDLTTHHGPDKIGRKIIAFVVLFFIFTYWVFMVTSNVERDIKYTLDEIGPLLNKAKDDITNGVFNLPIEFVIFVDDNDAKLNPQLFSQQSNPLLTTASTTLNNILDNNLINEIFIGYNHKQEQSPLVIKSKISFQKIENFSQFDTLSTIDSIDTHLFIPSDLDSDTLRYYYLPKPHGIVNDDDVEMDKFYAGKYTHSIAFYNNNQSKNTPTTLISTLFPTKSSPSLPNAIQSLLDLIWAQVQPAALSLVNVDEIKQQKTTLTKPQQLKLRKINSRFTSTYGLSIIEYLDLQVTPQPNYQVDFTMLSHTPMVSEENRKHTTLSQSFDIAIAPSILNQALDLIKSMIEPGIQLQTTVFSKFDVSIFTPQVFKPSGTISALFAPTTKGTTSTEKTKNEQKSEKINPLDNYQIFTLDNTQLGSLATKYLSVWKPPSTLVPTTPTTRLLGPAKLINLVIFNPNLQSYIQQNENDNNNITSDAKCALLATNQNMANLDEKFSSQNINNIDFNTQSTYLEMVTSSIRNTIGVPQWGTISILQPIDQNDKSSNNNDNNNNNIIHSLTQNQQLDLVQTMMVQLKSILGIGLNFNSIAPSVFGDNNNNNNNNDNNNNNSLSSSSHHPTNQIPISLWQKSLYYRSISLRLTTQITQTIQSTFNLLDSASYMPFPSHISRLLTVGIELLQDVALRQSSLSLSLSSQQQQKTQSETNSTTTTTTSSTSMNNLSVTFSALSTANELTTAVFYHRDLLPQLFFPLDQTMAIYAPFFAPILVPVLAACIKAIKALKKKKD